MHLLAETYLVALKIAAFWVSGSYVSKYHRAFIFKGSWFFFKNTESSEMKLTQSFEASGTPYPAIWHHIQVDSLGDTATETPKCLCRLHILVPNCISTTIQNQRHISVTNPYAIQKTIKSKVGVIEYV